MCLTAYTKPLRKATISFITYICCMEYSDFHQTEFRFHNFISGGFTNMSLYNPVWLRSLYMETHVR